MRENRRNEQGKSKKGEKRETFVSRLFDHFKSPETGVTHLFATAEGIGVDENNAFTPPGYLKKKTTGYSGQVAGSGETQNFLRLFYPKGSLKKYGYSGGLVINFTHIGPIDKKGIPSKPNPKLTNSVGSVSVGVIGGFGSDQSLIGGSSDGFYTHSHMIFNSWDGKSAPTVKTRIDPRKVFCSDLGF